MPDKKTLDYYVSELRRIEKSRQADSEKKIRKIFKNLLKDLNSFLAEEYANFSNGDGILSVAVLQEKARYAKFLQEVDEHLKSITVEESKAIQKTVEETYKAVYEGMVDAVTSSADNEDLMNRLEGLSVRPEVMNRAVNNPISGLTLPDTLEKHRKEVIYNIKQQINTGLMTGERFDTMAKNINKVLSGTDGTGGLYAKAMNIVRTEVHRVQESGFYDCAKEIAKCLEGSDLIYTATWHNMGDQRVRPNVRRHTAKGWKTYRSKTTANHEKLEGLTIKVGDKFEIEPGVFAECPGSSGTARNDCNCRCFLEYSLMNVEEFAKATGKTVEEVKKSLNIQENTEENSNTDDFVQAKTIEEAQTYAEGFCQNEFMAKTFKGKVDYKGISVENANEINRALTSVFNSLDIDKISGIKTISPKTAKGKKMLGDENAVFAYSPIEHGIYVNKDILKNVKTFEKYQNESKKSWDIVMNNIDKLKGSQKELALIYKNTGRSLVSGDTIEGLFTHELGHHVQWRILDTKTNNSIGANMSKYASKISGYANSSKGEYIAESFAAYVKGEKDILDKEFVDFLDKRIKKSVAKSAESGIIKSERKKINLQLFANIPEEKFTKYALNPEKDFNKATAFKNALGYDLDNYKDLIADIDKKFDMSKAKYKNKNSYGSLYEQIMCLEGPNGKKANVCTGWILEEGSTEPRLTSAYVTNKKVTKNES